MGDMVPVLGSCALHLSLSSIYKPNFISIPFVLSKIWLRKASIIKYKMLRRDNSVNIQGRIMVPGFCLSSHCHIYIYIYIYTNLYLNVNSSFKVSCRTRYWTDYMLGEHNTYMFDFIHSHMLNTLTFV